MNHTAEAEGIPLLKHALRLDRADLVDGTLLTLPLTRDEMADFLGLSLETVSRQFGRLRNDGLIDLIDARHIAVPDWPTLIDAAGDAEME